MKTKQVKEEQDKSIDEETIIEPKTRARKKASDIEEDKSKGSQDEPKTSKDTKRTQSKPRAIVKKRPLGIRKTLRSKKTIAVKEKAKHVIKQAVRRGRKPAVKTEPDTAQEKDTVPLIPACEIKKEPIEDSTPGSRSSSPKTAGRRQRVSSDMAMMKTMLSDTPSTLVLGPRTSPYSMRSERSNSPSSPSLFEGKNLRSGKPRKVKNNLLNEVVKKEQKKRRRLLSDSKNSETVEGEDCKKLKRGRSCSRDGSEVSKCSDNTESDMSTSETLNDSDSRELNKKLDKSKTDLDVDIENNVQISTTEKVPSLNVDSKVAEAQPDAQAGPIVKDKKKNSSLIRSTSLDSDNNNSNRVKLETLNSSEDKQPPKTENDTLFQARSSILTLMSETFNSKAMAKNIRRARRGKKAAAEARKPPPRPAAKTAASAPAPAPPAGDAIDDKHETIETLSKDIDDLIKNLDQNIDRDLVGPAPAPPLTETKSVGKFYGLNKPTSHAEAPAAPDTPVKEPCASAAMTPLKDEDNDNMRLHYEEEPAEPRPHDVAYKCNVASIDKLMDRLKEFEEFDKRRQRQESESRSDGKPVMVTSDVVLITKCGADIKPLKGLQAARSPDRPLEKENVLSCFENNSAISIVKREQARRSLDVDRPDSVTLIKRKNSVSARKDSAGGAPSDAISIFEKSLGRDVTLTEIRKSSAEKVSPAVELHQFATLHPASGALMLDSSQISITPRVPDKIGGDVQIIAKRRSRESMSRKNSESTVESEDKSATIEKLKSPTVESAISIMPAPAAVKSPEPPPVVPPPVQPPPVLPPPVLQPQVLPPPVLPPPILPQPVLPPPVLQPPVLPPPVLPPPVLPPATLPPPILPPPVQPAPVPPLPVQEPLVIPAPTDRKAPEPEALPSPVDTVAPADAAPVATEAAPVATETPSEPAPELKPEETIEDVPQIEEQVKPVKEQTPEIVENKNEVPEIFETETAEKVEVEAKPEPPLRPEEIAAEAPPAKEDKKVDLIELKDLATEIKPAPTEESKSPGRPVKSRSSTESQPGPSCALHETPESQKRKENVLRTLGLLTHEAAKAIEKLREERIYSGLYSKGKSDKSSGYSTGTLKTIIKLNRSGEKKKHNRTSLKMTFQKSKYRSGKQITDVGEAANDDDTFYTIERREAAGGVTDGGQRKSHYSNRNNHDGEAVPEPSEPQTALKLVIPEKASSFSIHPGRLCQDQCFYCGGKFGLFDTPCHIAQIKSSERQKKVLDNEEKLTIDSCLCDACYRHVDRRANCPSYRKRPLPKHDLPLPLLPADISAAQTASSSHPDKPPSPPVEEESEEEGAPPGGRPATCHTEGCAAPADHSIRRKWLIKMRSSVNKVLKLKCDYPGLHTIPLCGAHYRTLGQLMACALCARRLTKHHNLHFIHHGYLELNPLLTAALIPVQFLERPVLCKTCRYYCTLLQRPGHNQNYATTYRRKLLQIYNIEVPPDTEVENADGTSLEDSLNKHKKKQRNKSKQRKSTEPESNSSETSEKTNDSTPEKKEGDSESDKPQPLEEDIESLISSNKILVPGAKPSENTPSDGSETEGVFDFDGPLLPVDKQTELQYLLQKQNNPAQFMQGQPNLTQKQRNFLSIQSVSGIQKPATQHRISDKNAKRIQKLGIMMTKEKVRKEDTETEDKQKDGIPVKNITLNDECTIESIPNKRPADINTLKNKWQMSESFTQVKRNLSELSKKLDKDVVPSKKTSEAKYSNPVKRLETNPSISVRELFPGEEEMNLQCNIEFNNVKGVTPEGWEKCNAMIQYDVETKKLWNELQRPYGNQSSFLRHLILLEKYFRSGDLVLANSASPNAATYSDSVQSRLRAYDNVANDAPRRSEPAISLIEFRKKPAINGKSLLKSNQTEDKDPKKFMPPPSIPKTKKDKTKNKQVPPELIAINTPNAQGRKAIQNVLHNIQQLVKGVSASDPTEVAAAPLPAPKFDPPVTPKFDLPTAPKFDLQAPPAPVPKEKKDTKTDTPSKTKTSSKPWRPTLMPITPENLSKISREATQVAVDGRNLPSLVTVMSSGKRYHITLQDYNKMCVMRREKLQQLHDGEKKRPSLDEHSIVTELQPSTMLGNGGSVTQLSSDEKSPEKKEEMLQIGANAANILKNVGLKNITIAPIPAKTSTMTSFASMPVISSPSVLVTSAPLRFPGLGPAVSITPDMAGSPQLAMPRIPRSLTVIPQSAGAAPADPPRP